MDEVLAEIPMKEAVRYKKGNLKWTRSDIKNHSEALACGLLELGCKVRRQLTQRIGGEGRGRRKERREHASRSKQHVSVSAERHQGARGGTAGRKEKRT